MKKRFSDEQIISILREAETDITNWSLYLILGAGQLDLDNEADLCEKLHEGAEDLYRVLSARLNVCRDSA